jgi:alpha-D-ribose 1-methylphosphonate 5-triphosphate synthase subunit PhnH
MITAAFASPVLSAQTTFRAVLNAFARPGSLHAIDAKCSPPFPLSHAAAAVALTLCDHDTPIWLDAGLGSAESVWAWLRFHCGSPIVDDSSAAAFAFVSKPSELPPFDCFNLGMPEYPDRSTTIVLQVESLRSGPKFTLTGPGIRGRRRVQVTPLPADICARLRINRSHFPRGIDLLLVAGNEIAALPRSTSVVSEES